MTAEPRSKTIRAQRGEWFRLRAERAGGLVLSAILVEATGGAGGRW